MKTRKEMKADGYTEHKHYWTKKGVFGTTLIPKYKKKKLNKKTLPKKTLPKKTPSKKLSKKNSKVK